MPGRSMKRGVKRPASPQYPRREPTRKELDEAAKMAPPRLELVELTLASGPRLELVELTLASGPLVRRNRRSHGNPSMDVGDLLFSTPMSNPEFCERLRIPHAAMKILTGSPIPSSP